MPFFHRDQEDVLARFHGHEETHEDLIAFLKGTLSPFLAAEVAPHAGTNDRDEVFPIETFRRLGEIGFTSLHYPEAFEGMEATFDYYCAGLESLAKADAGFALGVAIHGTATEGILKYGSDDLRRRYVADLCSGRRLGAFALTEVSSGSDAKQMSTRWTRDGAGGDYILNGAKYWITNAVSAEVFFVLAVDDSGAASAFVVEHGGKGTFGINPIKDKMGVRSSDTAEMIFADYHVPKENRIGEEGAGFRYAMHMLNGGRITISAWSTGIAQGAYEKILRYAHERALFGKLLRDLDVVSRELSSMQIDICASRQLAYAVALDRSRGKDVIRDAAIAKVKGTETSVRVAERAIQLAGGYGFVRESRIERHLRDALLGRIGEGANELLTTVVIPRRLYKDYEAAPPTDIW